MIIVCQTCGDVGFEEALLYCDSCKTQAIHRYCMGMTPTPFTENISWTCEDCAASERGCDSIEVEQSGKFGHYLVTDHVDQDAGRHESVKVSSSSVIEVKTESEGRETPDKRNFDDLTGLAIR